MKKKMIFLMILPAIAFTLFAEDPDFFGVFSARQQGEHYFLIVQKNETEQLELQLLVQRQQQGVVPRMLDKSTFIYEEYGNEVTMTFFKDYCEYTIGHLRETQQKIIASPGDKVPGLYSSQRDDRTRLFLIVKPYHKEGYHFTFSSCWVLETFKIIENQRDFVTIQQKNKKKAPNLY